MKLVVSKQEDRETVALILVKNGYAVKFGTAKTTTGKTVKVVEYEEGE